MNIVCVMFYTGVSHFRITRHSSAAALVRAAGSSADLQEILPWSYYQGLSVRFARLHGGTAGGRSLVDRPLASGVLPGVTVTGQGLPRELGILIACMSRVAG